MTTKKSKNSARKKTAKVKKVAQKSEEETVKETTKEMSKEETVKEPPKETPKVETKAEPPKTAEPPKEEPRKILRWIATLDEGSTYTVRGFTFRRNRPVHLMDPRLIAAVKSNSRFKVTRA